MATEKTWETILRTNSADLLVRIDTESGLEGVVKTLGFTDLQMKNIWGVKDNTIKRNERLLEFLRKGDFEWFKIFCEALVTSGQKSIVTRHLSGIKETWSSCSTDGSNDPRSYISLKESYRDCLRQNWNYLLNKIDNLSEIEAQLKTRESLTPFQQIQLQDLKEDVDKVCLLLRLLENGSQKLFDDFCEILKSTRKQYLVVTLTPSDAQRALDDVKTKFLGVKLEPASDIERQRKLEEIESKTAYSVSHGGVTGKVLIFSNRYFGGVLPPRNGTELDEENLTDFFKNTLNFETVAYSNRTSEQMKQALEDEAKQDMIDFDIFIVFFLSHGRNGEIFGLDGKTVRTSEIVDGLDGEGCPQLAGKPKLIFIQACRDVCGTQVADEADGIKPVLEINNLTMNDGDPEAKVNLANDAVPEVEALPTYHAKADMAIFYATVIGDKSYRRQEEGSFFVRHLLDVFTKKAHTEDVVTMVTEALRRVHELQIDQTKKRQLGEQQSSLLRKVYLVI